MSTGFYGDIHLQVMSSLNIKVLYGTCTTYMHSRYLIHIKNQISMDGLAMIYQVYL